MDHPSTSTVTERTPLVHSIPGPTYVFEAGLTKRRQTRIKQFQTCICIALLAIFGAALLITVSYTLEHNTADQLNGTATNLNLSQTSPSENNELTTKQRATLLALPWPRPDTRVAPWSVEAEANSSDDADNILEAANTAGAVALYRRTMFEMNAIPLAPQTPAYRAQRAAATGPRAVELAMAGYAADHATRNIANRMKNSLDCCIGTGPKINASWLPPDYCNDEQMPCPPSKYSRVDGRCNNLLHPKTWGVALTPFRRALPPDYFDGVSAPRRASDGSDLPSAREVSLAVHRPSYDQDPEFTVMLAVWGQFLDHDITATALNKGINGSAISCCHDTETPGLRAHPECFPVPIKSGDPNYDKHNMTCMEFVRSIPAPACNYGPRNQLNQATAFIDASIVYGPEPSVAQSLRSFVDGELRVLRTPNGRELLPKSTNPADGCNEEEQNNQGKYCFEAGDARANENLHLTTMHVVWTRHHNAVARELRTLNPHWNDERLYQEARRIIIAQVQHISYKEFLPVLFGSELVDSLDLRLRSDGYYNGYDETVNPSIANNFAAAAYRFAHTLLPSLMKYADSNARSVQQVQLHTMLFNPYSLYGSKGIDDAMKSAMENSIKKVDPHVSNELTSHLFVKDQHNGTVEAHDHNVLVKHGLDLVSLNIQRGRDHGLPSYPNWRTHCGFSTPSAFEDLRGVLDEDSLDKIASLYRSVDDVDLYTGALSERPMDGQLLGPTLTCLLADQFVRLRRGDRYWYESPQQPQAFTLEQLAEIRKTTLAGIICKNGDSLKSAQRHVMHSICKENPLVPCEDIENPNLSLWKKPTL